MTKKKTRLKRHPKAPKPYKMTPHDEWVAQQVNVIRENGERLIEGIRAHLKTMQHTLSLDAESRNDLRAMRDDMMRLKREIRRQTDYRLGIRVPLRDD